VGSRLPCPSAGRQTGGVEPRDGPALGPLLNAPSISGPFMSPLPCAVAVALATMGAQLPPVWAAEARPQAAKVCNSRRGDSLLQVQARRTRAPLDNQDGSALDTDAELQKAGPRTGGKIATRIRWCFEKNGSQSNDCWAAKPGPSTPACNASSGNTTCRCYGNHSMACHIDALDQDPPTTGRCKQKHAFVEGEQPVNGTNDSSVSTTGSDEEVFCTDMIKNDLWKDKHLVKLPEDPPAVNNRSWLLCWWGSAWHDGKCQRKVRYLGETCWGSMAAGQCAGSTKPHKEYSTACYKGRCVPSSWAQERHECSCSWFGLNLILACVAANGKCGGHACVMHDDGKRYCDFTTTQDW